MRGLRLFIIMGITALVCLSWKHINRKPPQPEYFDYDDFLDYKYGRGKYEDHSVNGRCDGRNEQ